MVRRFLTLASVAVLLAPSLAYGQADPAPEKLPSWVPNNVRIDRGDGIHFTKHLAVVFGGIKRGSSIAVGPAVSWEPANGSFIQIKGGFSVKRFKLLQARYDSPPLFNKRSVISTRLRWQDAPELPLFQRGPDSPDQHLDVGMTKTEWSAFLRTTVAPNVAVSVGSGVERYSSKGKWTDAAEAVTRLGVPPDAPGLATRPLYVRSFASAAWDTRLSPDYSRTGHLLEGGLYHYNHVGGDTQAFERIELSAVKLLPTFRSEDAGKTPQTQYKGALSLFGYASLTHTTTGHEVPFYLMSYLGGGDYLRAYSSYRFHDRNAMVVGTEYRYAIHKMVDVAVLLEAGTVAPSPSAFSMREMAGSVAAGIRVHSKSSGLLRLDLAHGRDGFNFSIGVTNGS